MPGYNHYANCTCGWCRGGGGGGSSYRAARTAYAAAGTSTSYSCGDFCCQTQCPTCGALVYFVRHNGGSVWFDSLGKPWPKHSCFYDDGYGRRLRLTLAEKAEETPSTFFGIVTETVVTEPGEKGRFVIRCSDGRVIDDEFTSTADITEYPGDMVVIEESQSGRYTLHRVRGDDRVIEVWWCEKLNYTLIYEERHQPGTDETSSRFYIWEEDRWLEHRDFNIQPLLRPLDDPTGLEAARIAQEYRERYVTPPGPRSEKSRRLASLFDALLEGRPIPKPKSESSSIEAVIFPGTPSERTFLLPTSLKPERVAEWIKEVEAARRGKEKPQAEEGKETKRTESDQSP